MKFETVEVSFVQTDDNFSLGYIHCGHGLKGRQFAVTTDESIGSMYKEYHGRKENNFLR